MEPKADTSNHFKVKVIGKGQDCEDTYLVEFQNKLEEVYQVAGGEYWTTFYADSLADIFKLNNLELLIKFRNPKQDEISPCTALGPTYPHIVITDVIKE